MAQAIGVATGAYDGNSQQALTHALLETVRWAVSEEEEKNSQSEEEHGDEEEEGSGSEDSDMQGPPSPVNKKKLPPPPKAGVPGGPCAHCGASESPQWRRPLAKKVVLCNACGIYYSRHHSLPKRKKPAPPPAAPEPMDISIPYMSPAPLENHHSDVEMTYAQPTTSPAHLQTTHVTSRPRFLSGPQGSPSSLRPTSSSRGATTGPMRAGFAPPLPVPLPLACVIPGGPSSLESTHAGSSHSHSHSRSASPVASTNDQPATPVIKPDIMLALTGMQPLILPQAVAASPSSRKRGMSGVGLQTAGSLEVAEGAPALLPGALSLPMSRVVSWGSAPLPALLPFTPSLPNALAPARAAASWELPTVAQQLQMAQAAAGVKRPHMEPLLLQSVGGGPQQALAATGSTPTGSKMQRPTITTAIMDPSTTSQAPKAPTTTMSTAGVPSASPSPLNSSPPPQPSSSFEATTHDGPVLPAAVPSTTYGATLAACSVALPAMPSSLCVSAPAAASTSATALVPAMCAGPHTGIPSFQGAPQLPPLRMSPTATGPPHSSELSADSESGVAGMLIGVYACRGPRSASVGVGGSAARRPTSGTPPSSPKPCASNC